MGRKASIHRFLFHIISLHSHNHWEPLPLCLPCKNRMDMNNEYKDRLQKEEFENLRDRYRVVLKWATGCGKSKMCIDLINNAIDNYPPRKTVKILFVVAERAHINNWQDEFEKWHLRMDRIVSNVICYASLKNEVGNKYDLVVFDEAHHAFTEKRLSVIETISADYVYLLSATLPSSKIEMMEEIYGKFTTSTVTLKDAIEEDILPDPRIYVVRLELDDEKANQEIRLNNPGEDAPVVKWKDKDKYVYKNTPCIIKCTQRQKYAFLTTKMEYWKRRYQMSHNQFQHNQWVSLGSQRKRFIGELKTPYAEKLIHRLRKQKRFVCFCASVDQASKLSSDATISSKSSSKYNQGIIDAFNGKKINEIFAIGMITEGMNLNGIEAGVIIQLDGKERLFVQKCGRVLRADDPIAYIFYYKNTQDEVYLKTALENIDMKYVKFINQ